MTKTVKHKEQTQYLYDSTTWLFRFMYTFFYGFILNDSYTYDAKPSKTSNILPITIYYYDVLGNLNYEYDYFCGNMTINSYTTNSGNNTVYQTITPSEEIGFDYFGARYLDSELSTWLSVDPMSDKYPSMSPYMYTAGNPIMLVDPDGREIVITGEASESYYNEAKKGASALGVDLKMNENGVLSGEYIGEGPISEDGQMLLDAINSQDVTSHINATNSDKAKGLAFYGGAFMGTDVNIEKIGKDDYLSVSADAYQTVNPSDLKQMDDHYNKPGMTSIHEITESYNAGLLTIENKESMPIAIPNSSQYLQIHNSATPQSGNVNMGYFDMNGRFIPKGSSKRIGSVGWAFPDSKNLIKEVLIDN